MELHDLGSKKGTGPICAKPGTDRRLVAGRSGKLDLSPFSGGGVHRAEVPDPRPRISSLSPAQPVGPVERLG